ncbi:hypothetical protein EDD85DRAFT_164290 [Armillaria nabsnona]|nr:hypothetical protein EDD85DRAFT_164290 [Armillaria nabsnona]
MMSPVKTGGRRMKLKTMSTTFKSSQRVVERVEALQEMVKEDEKGKVWGTLNESSMDDMLCIVCAGRIDSARQSRMEVQGFILSLLPRTLATALVFLSRAFLYAARAVFYDDLHMRDVRDALRIFLVTRRDQFSHAYPPRPCMGIRTGSGVSQTPHTRSDG